MHRALPRVAIACLALVGVPLAVAHVALLRSLAQLDGRVTLAGPKHPVLIERDELGVPSVHAADRADLAFALGFAHAQDRFFQMDLSRRLPAGELAELVGPAAARLDASTRTFDFRRVAADAIRELTPFEREILAAYARGVNAGLARLGNRPWEYWLLRKPPAPWTSIDTILVVHSMWWDLQSGAMAAERARRAVNARLGGIAGADGWKPAACFLFPGRTSFDAPNEPAGRAGSDSEGADASTTRNGCARLPMPEELDVRRAQPASCGAAERPFADFASHDFALRGFASRVLEAGSPPAGVGSNNWAVAGALTATGSALVASDMHLGLRVPAVWYRARLIVEGRDGALDLNGVTLPGAPVLVAGSNGHIAWAFTNSYGNWLDIDEGSCGPAAAETDCDKVRWLATVPAATNLRLLDLERADSTARALEVAPFIGIPHQNLVVGDRAGHIAWTIAGRIPDASGAGRNSGRAPWIAPQRQPRIVDPAAGRIWTANALSTGDGAQRHLIGGDETDIGADYDLGARGRQIRDDLLALRAPATPADMLRIQLDDRAVFLARWRAQALALLDAEAVRASPARAEFRRLIGAWSGRAAVDDVGYRLLHEYRDRVADAAWQPILRALGLGGCGLRAPVRFEEPLWRMLQEQPAYLLDPRFESWRSLLLAQIDAAIAALAADCGSIDRCRWGSHERVEIRHPLSGAIPLLARFLDMKGLELPGDHHMPRVQSGDFGASERFAVSPGHETDGYIHIAGGQSGHPLSPFYRAGFDAWAQGRPLPFLPGRALHRLVLQPDR